MKKLLVLVGISFFSASTPSFAHNGEHTGHVGMVAQELIGKSYEIPGVAFKIFARSEDEEDAAADVREAITTMFEKRFEYPRFDEAIKKNALQSIFVEPKVTNGENKEFFVLVVRTQTPGKVKFMISASLLKDKSLLGHPSDLIPLLEREFQWVVSKADTAPKPKTMSSDRDLQNASIQNDAEILKMSPERRVEILRSLFDTYLRTVDDQKSLESEPYYDGESTHLEQPKHKDSTIRYYDIRVRSALEKLVSDPVLAKKYPRTIQSLLNGKIWSVAFVNVQQRDWATRTRVLTEDKAVKVGAESRLIQPAAVLINIHRKASMDDPFFNEVLSLPMGALPIDQLARVIALEVETNIIEKSMRGHTVTDEKSAPK